MSRRILIVLIVSVFIFGIECPSFAYEQKYPQLSVSGYKRWLYSKLEVAPTANYLLAVGDRLGTPGIGPWSEELELHIRGELNQDVTIDYNLRQNPYAADRYGLGLSYKNYSLIYGYPQELMTDQEFILHDNLSGLVVGGKWDKLKASLFSGAYPTDRLASGYYADFSQYKLFRNPQYTGDRVFSYYKDDPYLEYLGFDLGRIDIREDTLDVYLDKVKLIQNRDFFFDRAYGLVLVSGRFKNAKEAKVSYVLKRGDKNEVIFDFQKDARRRAFASPDFRILEGSEVMRVDGMRMVRDLDYRVNYNLGFFVMNEPLHDDAEVRIDYNYNYGANLYASETITGQIGTNFTLAHNNIINNSESVVKNDQSLDRSTDYVMNYTTGSIRFVVPLTLTDTVEVSYTYLGIRHDVMGANAEYEISDWSRIGSSVVSINPSKADEGLYDQISPSSYLIWNLYNRTTLNEDTYFDTELSLSNRNVDFRNSNTQEADSALKVYGRTRFGDLELNGTYRKTGLNFASVRKVKSSLGWKEDKLDIALKYPFSNNLRFKGGLERLTSQLNSASSPEVAAATVWLGLESKLYDFWKIGFDYRFRRQDLEGVGGPIGVANEGSYLLWNNFDLCRPFPALRGFSRKMNISARLSSVSENGRVEYPDLVSSDVVRSRGSLGWLAEFFGGLSTYVLYSTERDDDRQALQVDDRIIPYCKISYHWDFGGGMGLEFYYDYSTTQQRGPTDYDKNERGFGMIFDIPVDNPVLSHFELGSAMKTTDYKDLNDSLNDYTAKEMNLYGSLVF